ncbi:ABC transporter ATP-binding protein [Saccharopolyspora sp. NPDC047091]|uniref:ABC transporter ATP-binding protein n=1 Tax=Saccharopolyspora sp. NPDC047091 TaxID=3155924 RepID=UPI0033BFE601
MAIFEVRSVHKSFGSNEVLADIDLDVAAGEFVCLLGPSGCGKSTLLEVLAGLQAPTSGEVRFRGEPITGPREGIGVVFQDASLYPWRTVLANVELGLELRGVRRSARRAAAREHLDLVGLSGYEDAYPHHLSGGMRQRAGIARALTAEPEVLLMDEPFGAVDHLTRTRLQQDLLRIRARTGATVVFVTHDVGEAVFLADRVLLLAAGPGRVVRTFDVDLPRPRERGSLPLLQEESRLYRALSESDERVGPAGS